VGSRLQQRRRSDQRQETEGLSPSAIRRRPAVWRRTLLGALLTLCAALTGAQAPWADWRTIETAHFRVHFPAPFEDWARRMAGSLEGIHERVTALVGYTPTKKTEILVEDPQADANGMAVPLLDRPVIVLWATAPEAESSVGWYRDWTEDLVTHEMAHIVHLTRPRNRAGVLSKLLPVGPVALNSPRWVFEGYATLVEGELTGAGRPNSSYRAMVLRRFAIEGKLPSYGALSSTGGWLGGSMAYLVGSSYLEWLQAREGAGSLVKLWKRMASRRGGSFTTAFRAVFGEAPGDLYDRFRAELTARALDVEKQLTSAGLAEGDAWGRFEGGVSSLEVSPDGGKLLARRDPSPGKSFLAVWDLSSSEAPKKPAHPAVGDPNEIEDKPVVPPSREPRWKLLRVNGRSAGQPRFFPDGQRVLFARRSPDAQAMERFDLYAWQIETGSVERVTRGADVAEADPSRSGQTAVGVRRRFGRTELVRVDLSSGRVVPIETGVPADAWPVWSHPRFSPDGTRIASLLHVQGRWRLVTLPSGGGAVTELPLPGSPFGPPSWAPDGASVLVAAEAGRIWNLAVADARGGSPPRFLTRVTGGAFTPAPSPDGREAFFLELTAKGVDVRRLALTGAEPAQAAAVEAYPILPPSDPKTVPAPAASAEQAPTPYRALRTQVLRLFSGFTIGPDGNAFQVGLQGTDVVGRLDWVAAASFGNAAGPRGGSLAAAWKGLPVELDAHAFASLEKPGSQQLVERPELDEQRWGFWAGGSWRRPYAWGSLAAEAGGGWTRVEPLARHSLGGGGAIASGETLARGLGGARVEAALRRRGPVFGFGLEADLSGNLGATGGSSWRQARGWGRATVFLGSLALAFGGGGGDTGGSPTRFDLFSLGGASSSILPPGLDRNRIESPALPEASQLGTRFTGWRAEATLSVVTLYAEQQRAWEAGPKPPPVKVYGGELRLGRLIPAVLGEGLDLYAGVAKIESSAPAFDTWRGYAGMIYRP